MNICERTTSTFKKFVGYIFRIKSWEWIPFVGPKWRAARLARENFECQLHSMKVLAGVIDDNRSCNIWPLTYSDVNRFATVSRDSGGFQITVGCSNDGPNPLCENLANWEDVGSFVPEEVQISETAISSQERPSQRQPYFSSFV